MFKTAAVLKIRDKFGYGKEATSGVSGPSINSVDSKGVGVRCSGQSLRSIPISKIVCGQKTRGEGDGGLSLRSV